MAIFDELEGLLGADVLAKLSPDVRAKLEFGEELTKYYDDATIQEPPVRKPARSVTEPVVTAPVVTAPVVTTPAATGLSAGLDDIAKLLDARLGNLDERIKTGVEALIKPAGDDLFNRAVARSIKLTDEISDVREQHRSAFGERLDTAAFDKFISENGGMGKFGSVEGAYKAWQGPKLEQKRIDEGIRDGLKQRNSGVGLPGVTPNSSKGPVSILSARRRDGSATGDGTKSAVERAAEALATRVAVNE